MALPTETVYGLAASIHSESALKSVFTTKGRPLFDPLIVHVLGSEQAKKVCRGFGDIHQAIAQKFWPGPVTLIGEKDPQVSELVTAGHSTVAVRCPSHPLFLEVLKKSGLALAAPSANRFKHTSPTQAEHVLQEFGGNVPVLDGGPSEVGIESVILKPEWREDEILLKVFRAGMIQPEVVAAHLEKVFQTSVHVQKGLEGPVQPGSLDDHYQPRLPLILVLSEGVSEQMILQKGFHSPSTLTLPDDVPLAARLLYASLRQAAETKGADSIVFRQPKWWLDTNAEALRDRLLKASTHVFS